MTAVTCECGQPVYIARSGECARCYERRRYREKVKPTKTPNLEEGQRYRLERSSPFSFRADASLALASGLLGVLLICDDCEERLGPVRSEERARDAIVAHLVDSHDLNTALEPGPLVRVRQPRAERYRDELPIGFHSDVSVLAVGLYGAVITCEACTLQLGPVFNAPSAAMAIHGHQLRAHNPTGRSLA
jgi:hypothetical protein